jgi:hypothetical protein
MGKVIALGEKVLSEENKSLSGGAELRWRRWLPPERSGAALINEADDRAIPRND